MNSRYLSALLLIGIIAGCSENRTPIDYVDPFIGTGYHGHTYPGASAPFGMVQLSPDTRNEGWDACSGYHYDDSAILGFSHTHLSGTGCADLADILFYPSLDRPSVSDSMFVRIPLAFSHDNEEASCGYYSVRLDGIDVELTARPRTGVHRYAFREGGKRYLLIDLMHTVTEERIDMASFSRISDMELSGMRRTQGWVADQYVFFNARFSVPFESIEQLSDRQVLLVFPESAVTIEVAVGLSAVSAANARENSLAEVPELDFDKAREEAVEDWRRALSDITVDGGTKRQKTIFYTSQYHSKLTPNLMSDINGEYRRSDGSVGQLPEGRKYYSTLSLWDTFRAWHPLQTIVDTAFVASIVSSMLDMYECTGELPIWPLSSGETGTMIGYHAVSVISDAYLRGIRGFDAESALDAMVRSSEINAKGSELYMKFGYIPSNIRRESVSLALEYAYDDWTIARMAEAMGKPAIAEEYYRRAGNYINVFDGSTGFFRGRKDKGGWTEPFEQFATGRDYTEATPWHYRFFVPHDIHGLEQLLGGREDFRDALYDLFHLESEEMDISVSDVTGCMGQYAHGNEPSHHMAYLYNYAGMPWKTQELTRYLLDSMYDDTPAGIIGNEDCGQMSAWYIFSSLGFYPVCPGSGEFILTSPLFENAHIRLADGKSLEIRAAGAGKRKYIKSVLFNGREVEGCFITYDMIMEGGVLEFVMSSSPSEEWGDGTVPYSMSAGNIVSVPYTAENPDQFVGSIDVCLASRTDSSDIRYTLDGSEPDASSALYEGPIHMTETTALKAKAFREGYIPSKTMSVTFTKAEFRPGRPYADRHNGVKYSYYEGIYGNTSDVGGKPVKSGVMSSPSIADAAEDDHFAYVFEGYVNVPERGVWEFMTKSDDGSVLFVDGIKVVDNDGSHASVSATGRIALDSGFHSYRLIYFEDYEGQDLEWGWKAPGDRAFSAIPEKNLFY